MSEIDFLIAVKVRAERLRLGFSEADLAAPLGLSAAAYMRRESGSERFSAEELQALLNALGRNPAWLYAQERSPPR